MTLDQARKGSEVGILSIPDGPSKLQLIRMGVAEGTRVQCRGKLPFGPILLRCHRQEIAVGRKLAQSILVG